MLVAAQENLPIQPDIKPQQPQPVGFRQKIRNFAEQKWGAKIGQSLGFIIGYPIGFTALHVAVPEAKRSLPFIGSAAKDLPDWFTPTFAIAIGISGTLSNYTGNFGAAVDVILKVATDDKRWQLLKTLTLQEIFQVFGALLGTVITMILMDSISPATSAYPIIGVPMNLKARFIQTYTTLVLGGFMANVCGHAGKGLSDSITIAKVLGGGALAYCKNSKPNNSLIELSLNPEDFKSNNSENKGMNSRRHSMFQLEAPLSADDLIVVAAQAVTCNP